MIWNNRMWICIIMKDAGTVWNPVGLRDNWIRLFSKWHEQFVGNFTGREAIEETSIWKIEFLLFLKTTKILWIFVYNVVNNSLSINFMTFYIIFFFFAWLFTEIKYFFMKWILLSKSIIILFRVKYYEYADYNKLYIKQSY